MKINQLLQKKFRMLLILLLVLFISYFALPISIAFIQPEIKQTGTYDEIVYLWVYTFLQIPLTWILGWIYYRFAKKIDQQLAQWQQGGRQ